MIYRRIISRILPLLLLAACSNSRWAAENPDPNHTHADFAVFIHGEKMDFSGDTYMSGASHGEYHHQHMHLHDNISNVLHRHKPGLSIGEFFSSLTIPMSSTCFVDSCNTEDSQWIMTVNSSETDEPVWEKLPLTPEYVFEDLDQILFTYGASEEEMAAYIQDMTDDSCLYSRTCPQRGDPPAENCIADPAVPCVAPLDDDF